jgi:hypothetical protein
VEAIITNQYHQLDKKDLKICSWLITLELMSPSDYDNARIIRQRLPIIIIFTVAVALLTLNVIIKLLCGINR